MTGLIKHLHNVTAAALYGVIVLFVIVAAMYAVNYALDDVMSTKLVGG